MESEREGPTLAHGKLSVRVLTVIPEVPGHPKCCMLRKGYQTEYVEFLPLETQIIHYIIAQSP